MIPQNTKILQEKLSTIGAISQSPDPPMHTYYDIPTVLTKTKHSIFIMGMSGLALVTESKMLCVNLKSLVKISFIVQFIDSRRVRNVPLAC